MFLWRIIKQYLPDTPSYLELCFHKHMWESLESHQRGDFSEQPQHIERWKMWAAPRKNGSLGHMGTVKIEISLTLKGLLLYIDIPYSTLASVAQLDAPSDWRPGGSAFNPRRGRQHLFVEIDHEIFFYGHSLPSADSRRAVVSFWRKNVHSTG